MAVDYTITDFTYLNPFELNSDPIEEYYGDIKKDLLLTGDLNDFSIYGRPSSKEEKEEPLDFARKTLLERYGDLEEYSDPEEQEDVEQQTDKQQTRQDYTGYQFSFINEHPNKKAWDRFNEAYDKNATLDNSRYRILLSEIAYLESSFINTKENSIGAIGYFQFMPDTLIDLRKRMKHNFSSKELKNNPELQIQAGINLAQFFENTLQKDLEQAQKKGITMSGLIFGAWLGGIGGVRDYLYKGIDRKDANGTSISSYIKRGNNIPLGEQTIKSINTASPITQIGNFNVTKAVERLHYLSNFNIKESDPKKWAKKNPNKGARNCGKAIRMAMEAGGLSTKGRPMYGGDYGPFLLSHGWYKLPIDAAPQAGDICVSHGLGKEGWGHISMYDGHTWISDYVQNDWKEFTAAKLGTNTHFYRYRG